MSEKKVVKARTALQNLIQADKLLSDEGRWIKNTEAKDSVGHIVGTHDPKAFSFCSLGAVKHIGGPGEKKAICILGKAAKAALVKLKCDMDDSFETPEDYIISLNDDYEYDDVRKMFRRAIKLAREGKRA